MSFNRPVAQIIYKALSSMDADEAVALSTLILADILADELLVHSDELNRVTKRITAERIEVVKREMARTVVAKARRGEDPSEALQLLEKAFTLPGGLTVGWNKQHTEPTGGQEHAARVQRAEKQLRDLSSGRFVQEHIDIAHDDMLVPPDAMLARHGITPVQLANMDPADKARFYQAYEQTEALIGPYRGLPPNQAYLHVIREHGTSPNGHIVGIPAGKLPHELFDPNHPEGKVVAVKVSKVPSTDAAGGTFDVFSALGANGATSANLARQFNGGIATKSTLQTYLDSTKGQASDEFTPSQRVFRHMSAGANLLSSTLGPTAPPQAKLALAVAHHVGELGPVAQQVVGPTLDRAAYRYRGTERKPDPRLVQAFANNYGKNSQRMLDANSEIDTALIDRDRQLGQNRASHSERDGEVIRIRDRANAALKAGKITRKNHAEIIRAANIEQAAARKRLTDADRMTEADYTERHALGVIEQKRAGDELKAFQANRAVAGTTKDGVWSAGPVLDYFIHHRLAKPELNDLQLKSGVVPPSEGALIDRNGKLSHQTVGYGDDHYLPFTLKNLRHLRGGEYIRTRTFGGPTTEDIHAGLMFGAKRLTVVSNSGIYTVTFDPTFKGGRRYNDKAMRMTGRYAHLLDALAGGKVGETLDPGVKGELRAQAEREFPGDMTSRDTRYTQLAQAYAANPRLSNRQKDEAAFEWLSTPSITNAYGEMLSPEQAARADLTSRAQAEHTMLMSQHRTAMAEYAEQKQRFDDNAENREQYIAEHPESAGRWNTPVPPATPESTEVLTQRLAASIESIAAPQQRAEAVAALSGNEANYRHFLNTKEQEVRAATGRSRLNGVGYFNALQALQEQFPYYFMNPEYHPLGASGTDDSGYVKPKALRPAEAVAGYYQHGTNISAEKAKYGQGVQAQPVRAEQAAGMQQASAAQAAPAPSVNAQQLADKALLEHLLTIGDKPIKESAATKLKASGSARSIANRTPANVLPDSVAFLYGAEGNPRAPEAVRAEFARNPLAVRQHILGAVDFINDNDLYDLDQPTVAASRGVVTVPFVADDTTGMLAKPNADYDLKHLGPAYGQGATEEQIRAAYMRDNNIRDLVGAGMLPDTPDAGDYDQLSGMTHNALVADDTAYNEWFERTNGFPPDDKPVDRGVLNEQTRGLVKANQLHRRLGDAARSAKADEPNVTQQLNLVFPNATTDEIEAFDKLPEERKRHILEAAMRTAGMANGLGSGNG